MASTGIKTKDQIDTELKNMKSYNTYNTQYSSNGTKVKNKLNSYNEVNNALADWAGYDVTNTKQIQEYIRDATNLGLVDTTTSKYALQAYNKLKDNNFNTKKLSSGEVKSITNLLKSLYKNDQNFKYIKDVSDMDIKEAINTLGSVIGSFGVPAPTYLDTDFAPYQKKVDPVKHYTNKELAELYKLDYNFDNIKAELDAAAEAQVKLKDWESALLANNAERDNNINITDYLDSLRNIKSEAIQKGMSNGARAAAEVAAMQEAINNKVQTNYDTAVQRFETMSDALKQRAETQIAADTHYDQMAQYLSNAGTNLYANDINRYGQDLLANANFLSSDENLRSTREAQNRLMRAIYNSANAQASVYKQQALDDTLNYFNEITLPANNYNLRDAYSNYINAANAQNYRYIDLPTWKGQKY